jgi:hypothetical protein
MRSFQANRQDVSAVVRLEPIAIFEPHHDGVSTEAGEGERLSGQRLVAWLLDSPLVTVASARRIVEMSAGNTSGSIAAQRLRLQVSLLLAARSRKRSFSSGFGEERYQKESRWNRLESLFRFASKRRTRSQIRSIMERQCKIPAKRSETCQLWLSDRPSSNSRVRSMGYNILILNDESVI